MKNALLRLREARASLSAAEQQIARYIIDNPEEALRAWCGSVGRWA